MFLPSLFTTAGPKKTSPGYEPSPTSLKSNRWHLGTLSHPVSCLLPFCLQKKAVRTDPPVSARGKNHPRTGITHYVTDSSTSPSGVFARRPFWKSPRYRRSECEVLCSGVGQFGKHKQQNFIATKTTLAYLLTNNKFPPF